MTLEVLNSMRRQVFDIRFIHNGDDTPEELTPYVADFQIRSFTRYEIQIKIDFDNVLYVSAFKVKDTVQVAFLNSMFFLATKDGLRLVDGYMTNTYVVPSQARSEEEYKALN